MTRPAFIAAALIVALTTAASAQPKPSGTPDRPTATGTDSTMTGSPSMRPDATREPGSTATTQPPGSQVPANRTNGRQDVPRR